MRLLIASDLHGSLDSLRFLCDTAQRLSPDMLVLLGDLVYHGPRNPLPGGYDTRSVLEELDRLNHLPCPVTAVRGNCDAEVDIMLTPFAVSENAWIEADALRIFASHTVCRRTRLCRVLPRARSSCAAIPTSRAARAWTACTSGTPAPSACPRADSPAATACMRTAASTSTTWKARNCCATGPARTGPIRRADEHGPAPAPFPPAARHPAGAGFGLAATPPVHG